MPYLVLEILWRDNTISRIKYIKRVTNIDSDNPRPLLYYETFNMTGNIGKYVPMERVQCWEVTLER